MKIITKGVQDEVQRVVVNKKISYEKATDGNIYYYLYCQPVGFYPINDLREFKVLTSQLIINGHCKNCEIVKAFGVSEISVKRSGLNKTDRNIEDNKQFPGKACKDSAGRIMAVIYGIEASTKFIECDHVDNGRINGW